MILKITLNVFFLALLPLIATAHHSRAAYDTDTVTVVEGDLIDVRWRNPHIVFTLKVTGGHGDEVLWRMEAGSIYMLRRSGLSEALFRTGVKVKVAGFMSKQEGRDFLATSMLMPGGQEILTMPNATAHWSNEKLGGQDQWIAVETSRIDWPWFDGLGTPQSDAVKISERFTLSEDERRLDYRITIDDPKTLTRPGTVETYWLALGETVEPFGCEVY